MKKLLSLLIAAVMLTGAFTALPVSAAEAFSDVGADFPDIEFEKIGKY